MKKTVAIVFALLLTLAAGLVGCGDRDSFEEYDYTGKSQREFQFKTFLGVPSKMAVYNANETSYYIKDVSDEEFDAYYREMAEAGFTVATAPSVPEDETHNLRMLDAAEKYGLKQLLGEMTSPSGVSLTRMMQGRYTDPNGKDYADYTDEEIKTLLTAFLAPYIDHPAFYGLAIWDEPSIKYYDNVARAKRIFDEVAPGKLLYVNLLPITAGQNSLGVADMKDFLDYATEYIEKVDLPYLSYDRYALVKDREGNTVIQDDFLYNMHIYRQAADMDDRELWTYLLATEHTFGTTNFAAPDNIADIRWQVYSFLAFGGDSITWFTYFPPSPVDSDGTRFGVGPYDRKGRKTEIYYFISAVQKEVHAMEEVYFNFDWKSTMTVLGKNSIDCPSFNLEPDLDPEVNYDFSFENSPVHERISAIDCAEDTLIGCFEDADGMDGFMITNYANPGDLLESRTAVNFKDAYAAAVYRRGEKRIVKLGKDGLLDLTLLPGEGVFVVPLAKK